MLDVNGVGYGLDVPTSTTASLPEQGQPAELFCHLYVQEQVLRLYGFFTEEERDVFEVFIGTSGIGPKTALSILSSIEIGAFARAILREDIRTLTTLPGIGKKTAERLVLELREKVAAFADSTDRKGGVVAEVSPAGVRADAMREAMEALEALGCKPIVASRAVQKAFELLGPDATIEDLIREGLKHRR